MSANVCPSCGRSLERPASVTVGAPLPSCRFCLVREGATELSILTRTEAGEPGVEASVALPPEFLSRYGAERVLGCGAMGMVYQATRRSDGRRVAIKFLARPEGPGIVARFLAEGKVTGEIRHPNVVALFETGQIEGHLFLVLEFLDGGTLRARMREAGALGLAEANRAMLDCLAGLRACHERGVVHRDLKPENILFTGARQAKIADLGIAKAYGEDQRLTRTGDLIGTPRYMSPEQVRGEAATVASDIYAMGLVFYEMLAGRHPFSGNQLSELFEMQLTAQPEPLQRFASEVPDRVARLVEQALSKRAADRPDSAEAFAAALRKATGPQTFRGASRLSTGAAGEPAGLVSRAGPQSAPPAVQGERGSRASRWLAGLVVALIGFWGVNRAFRARDGAAFDQRPSEVAPSAGPSDAAMLSRAPGSPESALRLRVSWGSSRYRSVLAIRRVAFSGDGKTVIVDGEDTREFWSISTGLRSDAVVKHRGDTIASSKARFLEHRLGPDGRGVEVVDAGTGRALWRLPDPVRSGPAAPGASSQTLDSRLPTQEQRPVIGELSVDERTALLGYSDGTVALLDLAAKRWRWSRRGHSRQVLSLALSSDARRGASVGADDAIRLWDLTRGSEIPPGRPAPGAVELAYRIAFVPGSDRVFIATGPRLGVWEPPAPGSASPGRYSELVWGGSGPIEALAVSPDGKFSIVAPRDTSPSATFVHDLETFRFIQLHAIPGQVTSVSFSPDSSLAVSGCADGSIRLWNLRTARETSLTAGHTGAVDGVAISGDGETVLSRGRDRTYRVWRARTGMEHVRLKWDFWLIPVISLGLSPDGKLAVLGRPVGVELYRTDTGRRLWTSAGVSEAEKRSAPGRQVEPATGWATFSEDGREVVLVRRERVVHLELGSGRAVKQIDAPASLEHIVALTPGGRHVAFLDRQPALRLWRVGQARTVALGLERSACQEMTRRTCSFAADGSRFVTCDTVAGVRVWDAASGSVIRRLGEPRSVETAVLSRDGRWALLVSSHRSGGLLNIHEVATGDPVAAWVYDASTLGSAARAAPVAFFPDGRSVLVGTGIGPVLRLDFTPPGDSR
ncbi:MAG: protein kinase [Candidatus Riflebacteria bacterium]|nr:protein kinase [Candidatus Riflebacteria bacterium]